MITNISFGSIIPLDINQYHVLTKTDDINVFFNVKVIGYGARGTPVNPIA